MTKERIYLSPPNVNDAESEALREVLKSGWVAPMGSSLDLFEKKLENHFAGKRVLALNSGTAALHLSLILAGISDGDQVLVSSVTFAACANVILYERALPVFIDSEKLTWNLDPELLAEYLAEAPIKPKAIIVTHLYGTPAQMNAIKEIAVEHGIVLIEDAAEALGATYYGKQVGQIGDYGILSFNGNKIITTSGGGALISDGDDWLRGLHLSTQANSGKLEYHHEEAGYNYRMSNVLAGLGVAQLGKLNQFLSQKRNIYRRYEESLSDYFDFQVDQENAESNRWLTVGLFKTDQSPIGLIDYLESKNIESRRLWKPLHMQPAYKNAPFVGNGIGEDLFKKGICLPSGTNITDEDQEYVIDAIREYFAS